MRQKREIGTVIGLHSHTAVQGLLAVGWDYVKQLWSETEGRVKSPSETWRDWAWSVAGPARRLSVGGTATRCWSSPSVMDPGRRAIGRGLVPNNACVPLWHYPHRNNVPQFPVSNFHAYFLNPIVLTALKCLGARIDALFITERERVRRPLVATLAWRRPGTPISSDTWHSPRCAGPTLGGWNIPSVFLGGWSSPCHSNRPVLNFGPHRVSNQTQTDKSFLGQDYTNIKYARF